MPRLVSIKGCQLRTGPVLAGSTSRAVQSPGQLLKSTRPKSSVTVSAFGSSTGAGPKSVFQTLSSVEGGICVTSADTSPDVTVGDGVSVGSGVTFGSGVSVGNGTSGTGDKCIGAGVAVGCA